MSSNFLSARNSMVINAVRPILIVLVVLIHLLPNSYLPINMGNMSGLDYYHLISETLSHNIARIAVPCFFLFAGYFFFFTVGDEFDWRWLRKQWYKRFHSVVIPYLLWNALFCVAIIIKNVCFHQFIGYDDCYTQMREAGLYGCFWGMPLNIPLWFLRDLMCMMLLSPLLFFAIKHLSFWAVVALAVLYCLNIESGIPGFSSTALFFFTAGSFFSIKRMDVVEFCLQVKWPAWILSLAVLAFAVIYNGSDRHEYIIRLFIPLGIMSLVCMVSGIKDSQVGFLASCSKYVFIVYALHWIYVRNIVNGFCVSLFGTQATGSFICYFVEPVIIIVMCVLVYVIFDKFSHKALAVLVGSRN